MYQLISRKKKLNHISSTNLQWLIFNSFTEIKATAWLTPAVCMFQLHGKKYPFDTLKSTSPNVLFKVCEHPLEKKERLRIIETISLAQ